jgi:hypothetical protein
MPSGAYAVDISPQSATLGTGTLVRRTVPLPPAGNTGTVKFKNVFLSLSANPLVQVDVTIFITGGGQIVLPSISVGNARTGIGRVIQVGDEAALVSFTTTADDQTVVAFVEYSTP